MSGQAARVVKVGGSLLEWRHLPAALAEWLSWQPPALNVLLAGGGPLAEAIRQADRRFRIGESQAHWLCVDAMSVTARLLAALLPSARSASRLAELRQALAQGETGAVVFDPQQFLRHDEPQLPGTALPRSWAVSSDSIAARLAQSLGVGELTLLKSADPPPDGARQTAARSGYVDEFFPQAARSIRRVRCVNLKDSSRRDCELR